MNFNAIVLKNLKHNFTKFMSYIFVNIFVIAVLFTYGSIVFNKNITEDPILSATMDFVYMGIISILLFSIAFISYTGIYFIKTRGKELGVYLTLGMTKKDLTRMIILESTTIMLISVVVGMLVGLCFSGLFYLVLSNVLETENLFYLDKNSFLLSLGVFFVVFLSNLFFSVLFIKRTDITKITKSDKTKGMKTPKKISGFFGIFLFVVSTTMLYLMFTDNDIVNGFSDDATNYVITNVTLQFISLYFLIASGLDFVVAVLSKNKEYYNKNILILSNLKYSFVTYKTTLYMISILTGMSILFMGIQLSFKIGSMKIIDTVLPYDYMIESRGNINPISEEEIYSIVEDNGGEVEKLVNYPYISNEIFRENNTWLYYYGTSTMIISESNFNKAFGEDIDVAKDELIIMSNMNENYADTKIDYDSFLVVDNVESGHNRASEVREVRPTREGFYDIIERDSVECLTYEKEKTTAMYYPFINSYGKVEFVGVVANVIDDEVYNSLVNPEVSEVYLFDINKGDDLVIYDSILDTLRVKNGDDSLWRGVDVYHDTKTTPVEFQPICKKLSEELTMKVMGMFSFTMTFISILFLISSSVVMYYKLVNDVEYERQQIELFKKIGLNKEECKSYLAKHTAVMFFAPLVLGGGVGMFYNYFFFYQAPNRNYLLMIVLIMFACFVVYDVIFYFIVRRSLVKNVGV